jgi:hypothetical protein
LKKETDGMAYIDLASQKNVGGGTEKSGGTWLS